MAASFFVGFRLHGYAKEYAKWTIARAHIEARRLKVKRIQRPLPHITLYGPAETNNLRRVIAEVERIGRKYTLIPFTIGGVDHFDEPGKVIYLGVNPSPELKQFQQELAESLIWTSTEYTEWDTKQRKFHSTVGMFATYDNNKFDRLFNYVEGQCNLSTFKQSRASIFNKLLNIVKKYILRVKEEDDPSISQHLLRVTIWVRGKGIVSEYDLVLKRLLSRREALSRYWWRKTIEKLRTLQGQPERGRLG